MELVKPTEGVVKLVPLSSIRPEDPNHGETPFVTSNWRDKKVIKKHFDSIYACMKVILDKKSIRPILVTPIQPNRKNEIYQRLDGYSRYWANTLLGIKYVLVQIIDKPFYGGQDKMSWEIKDDEKYTIQ